MKQTLSATIEVQYVDQPKDGKKQGTIKTVDGVIYGVFPDKLGLFQPKRRYQVQYSEHEFKGRKYRTVVACDPETETAPETLPTSGPQPSSRLDGEMAFAAALVAAGVHSQQVEFTPQNIARAMIMVRAVYREQLRQAADGK